MGLPSPSSFPALVSLNAVVRFHTFHSGLKRRAYKDFVVSVFISTVLLALIRLFLLSLLFYFSPPSLKITFTNTLDHHVEGRPDGSTYVQEKRVLLLTVIMIRAWQRRLVLHCWLIVFRGQVAGPSNRPGCVQKPKSAKNERSHHFNHDTPVTQSA